MLDNNQCLCLCMYLKVELNTKNGPSRITLLPGSVGFVLGVQTGSLESKCDINQIMPHWFICIFYTCMCLCRYLDSYVEENQHLEVVYAEISTDDRGLYFFTGGS